MIPRIAVAVLWCGFLLGACTSQTSADDACSWKQVVGCRPGGKRIPKKDKKCNTIIRPKWAGYCDCGAGLKSEFQPCGHEVFVCDFKCQEIRDQIAAAEAQQQHADTELEVKQ